MNLWKHFTGPLVSHKLGFGLEYRDQGYPPEAVFNYIALLGWGFSADRDVFTRDEMVQAFAIGNVGKAGAKFDVDKVRPDQIQASGGAAAEE